MFLFSPTDQHYSIDIIAAICKCVWRRNVECLTTGSVVYTLSATGGGTGPITYGMVETDKFFVDRATGEVKVRRLLDYEVKGIN